MDQMPEQGCQINQICRFMEDFAPLRLAEEWDNVGLLVGDRQGSVERVMTCLTVTPESVAEAIERRAELIVAHHPLPFRPLKRLTRDTTAGGMLLDLARNGIAVYSPHTCFDSASQGINQSIAERLGLERIQPLRPFDSDPDDLGSGRRGVYSSPRSIEEWTRSVASLFGIQGVHRVAEPDAPVRKVAVACGAAGEFLSTAAHFDCDTFLTGETNFHTCLEAKAQGISMVLTGHYASERFALEQLAERLREAFPTLSFWASESESDPLEWASNS